MIEPTAIAIPAMEKAEKISNVKIYNVMGTSQV
jgi:hypothetical protein